MNTLPTWVLPSKGFGHEIDFVLLLVETQPWWDPSLPTPQFTLFHKAMIEWEKKQPTRLVVDEHGIMMIRAAARAVALQAQRATTEEAAKMKSNEINLGPKYRNLRGLLDKLMADGADVDDFVVVCPHIIGDDYEELARNLLAVVLTGRRIHFAAPESCATCNSWTKKEGKTT